MDINARFFQPGDEEELLRLLETCFKGWPRKDVPSKKDYWTWRYVDNPLGKAIIVLAVSEEKTIGTNHSILFDMKIGDRMVRGYHNCELCVHPKYRRMGVTKIMKELRDKKREEVKAVLSYASAENPIVLANRRKQETQIFPHPIIELVKINDIGLHLKMTDTSGSWYKIPIVKLLKISEKIKAIMNRNPDHSELQIKSIDRFDDRVDIFNNKIRAHHHFLIDRSKEHLNWRYCDSRGGTYKKYLAIDEDLILGYVVLGINRFKADYPTGWVVDLTTLPFRNDVASALVSQAIKYFDSMDINVVRYWGVKGNPHKGVLNSYGFLNIRKMAPQVSAVPLYPGSEYDIFLRSHPNELHFQAGDTEYM